MWILDDKFSRVLVGCKYIKLFCLRFYDGCLKYNASMPKILYRVHAVQRMFEREIPVDKVRRALEAEDVIEDYSAEMPEPSRLLMGFQGRRPFHVVTAESRDAVTVVTVYLPDMEKWRKDFRSRKVRQA